MAVIRPAAVENKDEVWYLELPHPRIVELIAVLEGYEGMAVLRVLEKKRGIVELLVAPDLGAELTKVIEDLNNSFLVRRVPRPEGIISLADAETQGPGLLAEEADAER